MSLSREPEFVATDEEIMVALGDLVEKNHYQHSLRFIETNDLKDGFITIYTREDRAAKYKLRDEYFRDKLQLKFENAEGMYHFFVARSDALANEAIRNNITERRKNINEQVLTEGDINRLTERQKDLIKIAAFLNVFFPLPGAHHWTVYKDQILAFEYIGNKNDPDFGLAVTILKKDLEISPAAKLFDFDAELVKTLRANIAGYTSKTLASSYYQINNDPTKVLKPILEKINEMENALGKKYQISASFNRYSLDADKILYAFFIPTQPLEALANEYSNYLKGLEPLIAPFLEKKSSLPITLDYLFFNPKVYKDKNSDKEEKVENKSVLGC